MSTVELSETGFPSDFAWGAATSAYQIEGAYNADGKGESIWDRFSHTPGAIAAGDTGDVACDHYARWQDDLDLLARLNLPAYRFSLSWPRILPEGRGKLNPAGLDFYERLVEGLLARGITPFATLYHWDLPQALQDRGGWENRDTAFWFAEYADQCARRLGDRIPRWITHNEPQVVTYEGHVEGVKAPGKRNRQLVVPVAHHLLLSHGLATRIIRDGTPPGTQIGITLNISHIEPSSDREHDQTAARILDGLYHRWFLDPLFRGAYPSELDEAQPTIGDIVHADDMPTIHAPLDFLGVNYYTRTLVRADRRRDKPRIMQPTGRRTAMGWEVYPDGLYSVLKRVSDDYHPAAIHVTENGAAYADSLDERGEIHDPKRLSYLRDHLLSVRRALAEGVPIHGYFVWSLLDNFEWQHGFGKRFGIIYTDYRTQQRILKASGSWYARVAATNGGALETE